MKILMSVLLLACVPAASEAETFTFVNTSKPIGGVQIPATGAGSRPTGGQVFTIATQTTFASGRKTSSSATCAQWILPPGDAFGSRTICKAQDAAGAESYTSQTTCESPGPTSVCWGKLNGVGGEFKGKTGGFTFRNGPASVGTGYWTE